MAFSTTETDRRTERKQIKTKLHLVKRMTGLFQKSQKENEHEKKLAVPRWKY